MMWYLIEKLTDWKLELLIQWLKYYGLVFDWKPHKKEMEIKYQHKISIGTQLCVEEFKLKTPMVLLIHLLKHYDTIFDWPVHPSMLWPYIQHNAC